jgi:hypothetical protein
VFWRASKEEITMAKRELIDIGTDKRYVAAAPIIFARLFGQF